MISSLPSIAKAAEQIRAGEIRPLDLVEHCLTRIDQFEDRVHAWVLIDADGSRQEAKQQAQMLDNGIDPGPLAGIPIGIKDIVDVAGWPTKAGSKLRDNHVAKADAPLVRDLRDAGAIILGKTVTTQFACFDPPPTRNPWNLRHTPGGSSSGSAAAVALEMCMAAIGTQTGGSIVRPASYCGVAGLKPTFGKISLEGVVPVSPHLDHAGPIARRVSDLSGIYATLRNHFARCPESVSEASVEADSRQSYAIEPLRSEPQPRQFQLMESYFMEQVAQEVAAVMRLAIRKLQAAWSKERTLTLPPSFGDVHTNHYRIMAYDAAKYHSREYAAKPKAYGPNISHLLATGLDTSRNEYEAALVHQQQFQSEVEQMFDAGSIGIMPSTNTTAPANLNTTGDPRFNSPWSYAGVPSITIPCGITSDGMPCGLQLVGPKDSESHLLRAAAWCEQRIGFRDRPALLDE